MWFPAYLLVFLMTISSVLSSPTSGNSDALFAREIAKLLAREILRTPQGDFLPRSHPDSLNTAGLELPVKNFARQYADPRLQQFLNGGSFGTMSVTMGHLPKISSWIFGAGRP